jgi:lipoprotein-anchoring transpeptidase ErfK/SrfK
MLHFAIRLILAITLFGLILVTDPRIIAQPGTLPDDPSYEDLGRYDFPSQRNIPWRSHFILPDQSLERLFGEQWVYIARFNRLDRRHAYPGMTIKVPVNMANIVDYTPLSPTYDKAKPYRKFIVIDVTEQWIGAYEYGKLKFSMPAATGKQHYETPTGLYRVDARDRHHTSSLYDTDDGKSKYPMDYAIRFHVGTDDIAYWIHSRDLPGKPASHGCVGVFDEEMQKRVYGVPFDPVLKDAQKLYAWAVGGEEHGFDSGRAELIDGGPVVEVTGQLPAYQSVPKKHL